jgi:ribose 5-phosphate isomerase
MRTDREKRAASARASVEIEDGMILGLGGGSIAAFAVESVAARIAKGLRAPDSEKSIRIQGPTMSHSSSIYLAARSVESRNAQISRKLL